MPFHKKSSQWIIQYELWINKYIYGRSSHIFVISYQLITMQEHQSICELIYTSKKYIILSTMFPAMIMFYNILMSLL